MPPGDIVKFRFNAEEWEQLAPAERARRCRILAAEAETLARHATVPMKALYLQLAIQWKLIAAELVLE